MLTPPVVRVEDHPSLALAVPARPEDTVVAIRRGSTCELAGDDGDSKNSDGAGAGAGAGAGSNAHGGDGSNAAGSGKRSEDAGEAKVAGREGLSVSIPPASSSQLPATPRPGHVTPRPGETAQTNGTVWNPAYTFYKHQYVCCRLLCMDPFGGNVVTFMCASTAAYSRAWAALMGALSREEELDPIIAQYMCQVLRQFSQRDFEKLCAKFIEPAVVAGLVYHLGQPPFVDFLLDFLQPSLGAAATTFASSLLNRLVAVVARVPRSEYEDNLFANVCLLLCNIGDSPDARNDTTIRGYLVGRIIKVKDISYALIDATFAELRRLPSLAANQSWMLPVATTFVGLLECGCCHSFSASDTMRHNRSTSLCPLLVGLLDRAPQLGATLQASFKRKKKYPLHISQILDLWHSLLRVECGALDQAFCDSHAIEAVVDIFFSMRANSTLLARLMDLFESVLARDAREDAGGADRGLARLAGGYTAGGAAPQLAMSNLGYDALQVRFLRDCRLADRIVAFFAHGRGRVDDLSDSSVASGSESDVDGASPRGGMWRSLSTTGRRCRSASSRGPKRPASGAPVRPSATSSDPTDVGAGGGSGGSASGGGDGSSSPRPGSASTPKGRLSISLPHPQGVEGGSSSGTPPVSSVRRRLSGTGGSLGLRASSPARGPLQGDVEGTTLPRVSLGSNSPPRSPAHGVRPGKQRTASPSLRRSVDSPVTVMPATGRTATPRPFNRVPDKCLMGYVVCLANAIMQSRCSELLESDESWRAFVEGPLRTINGVWGESVLHDDEPDDDDELFDESRGSDGFNLWELDDDDAAAMRTTNGHKGSDRPSSAGRSKPRAGDGGGGGEGTRTGNGNGNGSGTGGGGAASTGQRPMSAGRVRPASAGRASEGKTGPSPLGALYDDEDNELMRSLVRDERQQELMEGDRLPPADALDDVDKKMALALATGPPVQRHVGMKAESPRARVSSAGRERPVGPRRNSAGDLPGLAELRAARAAAAAAADTVVPPTVAEEEDDDLGGRGGGGKRRDGSAGGEDGVDEADVVDDVPDEFERRGRHASDEALGDAYELPFSVSLERKLNGPMGGNTDDDAEEGKRRGAAAGGVDDSKAEVVGDYDEDDDDDDRYLSSSDDDLVEEEVPLRRGSTDSGGGKVLEDLDRRGSDDVTGGPRGGLLGALNTSAGEVVDDDNVLDLGDVVDDDVGALVPERSRRRVSEEDALSKLSERVDDDGRRGHVGKEPEDDGRSSPGSPHRKQPRRLQLLSGGDEDEVEEELIASPVTLGRFAIGHSNGAFSSPGGVALPVED